MRTISDDGGRLWEYNGRRGTWHHAEFSIDWCVDGISQIYIDQHPDEFDPLRQAMDAKAEPTARPNPTHDDCGRWIF